MNNADSCCIEIFLDTDAEGYYLSSETFSPRVSKNLYNGKHTSTPIFIDIDFLLLGVIKI
jgi:hypothetical protein